MVEASGRDNPTDTLESQADGSDAPERWTDLLTLTEARERFGLSEYVLYRWVKLGLLTRGRRVRLTGTTTQPYYLSHEIEGLLAKGYGRSTYRTSFEFDGAFAFVAA